MTPQKGRLVLDLVRIYVDRQKNYPLSALVVREFYAFSHKEFAFDIQASKII